MEMTRSPENFLPQAWGIGILLVREVWEPHGHLVRNFALQKNLYSILWFCLAPRSLCSEGAVATV